MWEPLSWCPALAESMETVKPLSFLGEALPHPPQYHQSGNRPKLCCSFEILHYRAELSVSSLIADQQQALARRRGLYSPEQRSVELRALGTIHLRNCKGFNRTLSKNIWKADNCQSILEWGEVQRSRRIQLSSFR